MPVLQRMTQPPPPVRKLWLNVSYLTRIRLLIRTSIMKKAVPVLFQSWPFNLGSERSTRHFLGCSDTPHFPLTSANAPPPRPSCSP